MRASEPKLNVDNVIHVRVQIKGRITQGNGNLHNSQEQVTIHFIWNFHLICESCNK